jgi:DNA-binding beta-propeller fold protein YncE
MTAHPPRRRPLAPLALAAAVLCGFAAPRAAAQAEGTAPAPPTSGASGRIAVSMLDRAEVIFLDTAGKIVGRAPTAHGPRGLALFDGRLFAAARGVEDIPGSTIAEIDATRMLKLRDISACARCAPRALAFDANGTMWVSAQAHNAVYVMRPPYEAPLGSVVVAWGWPTQIVPLAGREAVAVAFRGTPTAAVLDTRRAMPVELGPTPEAVAARPGTAEAWYALNPSGQLASVKLPEGGTPVAERFGQVPFPQGIAFTTDGKRALVTSGGARALVVFDAATRAETGRLVFETAPREIAPSPDGTRAALYFPETKRVAIVRVDGPVPARETDFALAGAPGDFLWIP